MSSIFDQVDFDVEPSDVRLPLPAGYPLNSTSAVYENLRTVKSGVGKLFGFQGYNSGAAQFILVLDCEGVPASGFAPVIVIPAAATSEFSGYFGTAGRAFRQGIVLANSSTGPTLTIGAADCWFDAQYV